MHDSLFSRSVGPLAPSGEGRDPTRGRRNAPKAWCKNRARETPLTYHSLPRQGKDALDGLHTILSGRPFVQRSASCADCPRMLRPAQHSFVGLSCMTGGVDQINRSSFALCRVLAWCGHRSWRQHKSGGCGSSREQRGRYTQRPWCHATQAGSGQEEETGGERGKRAVGWIAGVSNASNMLRGAQCPAGDCVWTRRLGATCPV